MSIGVIGIRGCATERRRTTLLSQRFCVLKRLVSGSGVVCDTLKIFLCECERVPKVSVEVPQELLDDLDGHVGDEEKLVNRSDVIRASIRKTLDLLDEIDERHGRVETGEAESN